ncbi:MAG TPA: hypothetical protein VHP34_00460 [Alphaproteobacteria bacterium]|nr:hypothetical protein [Alphaproteobacteria bacterium]
MTDPAKPKKYFVRFSQPEDEKAIFAFYDMNPHQNVYKREEKLLRSRIEDGSVVLIEDEKGKVVAASITYPFTTKDSDGVEHVKWQEVGTTRIALNGFPGLFDAMVTMQVLRSFLVEPPEDRFIAQMDTAPVQGMAKKLGWSDYHVSDELIAAKVKKLDQFKGIDPKDFPPSLRNNWFQAGIEALPVMASRMLKALDNPVLENKKTGEKIELDFTKSSFFNMFEAEIRNLAGKNFGPADKPDLKEGVQKRRDQWLKKYFR